MDSWTLVKDASPRPHAKYLVRREGFIHTATPCYGLHAPWWVQTKIFGGENDPVGMLPTDEWRPAAHAPSVGDEQ